MGASIQVDLSEFSRAIRAHAKVDTKKDLAEVTNQTCYSVGMAATKFTVKASAAKVEADLRRLVEVGQTKAGKPKTAPLVALIVNKRLGKGQGVSGAEMTRAIREEFARRRRALGYLRSGWLASVARFAALLGKPMRRTVSSKAGDGVPARPGISPSAEFWHTAFAEDTRNVQAPAWAEEGLRLAMLQQMQRMKDWAARKLQRTADKYAARLLR